MPLTLDGGGVRALWIALAAAGCSERAANDVLAGRGDAGMAVVALDAGPPCEVVSEDLGAALGASVREGTLAAADAFAGCGAETGEVAFFWAAPENGVFSVTVTRPDGATGGARLSLRRGVTCDTPVLACDEPEYVSGRCFDGICDEGAWVPAAVGALLRGGEQVLLVVEGPPGEAFRISIMASGDCDFAASYDDGDADLDCGDSSCGCVELCTNGSDDDQDGVVDCADVDCRGVPSCRMFDCDSDPTTPPEVGRVDCHYDEDGDGLGNGTVARTFCEGDGLCPPGTSPRADDCCDRDPSITTCDGLPGCVCTCA